MLNDEFKKQKKYGLRKDKKKNIFAINNVFVRWYIIKTPYLLVFVN
jgi:hypothetical protein